MVVGTTLFGVPVSVYVIISLQFLNGYENASILFLLRCRLNMTETCPHLLTLISVQRGKPDANHSKLAVGMNCWSKHPVAERTAGSGKSFCKEEVSQGRSTDLFGEERDNFPHRGSCRQEQGLKDDSWERLLVIDPPS